MKSKLMCLLQHPNMYLTTVTYCYLLLPTVTYCYLLLPTATYCYLLLHTEYCTHKATTAGARSSGAQR